MLAATRPIALVDEGLGNSPYLVDLGHGRALVVDPGRDPGPYLAAAQRGGLAVAYAAETHLHADFVSGSRELAARRGIATWLLGHAAGWLRLAQVERLLDYAWLDGTDPGGQDYASYRAFLPAAGFRELTRTRRGWSRTSGRSS